MKKPLAYRMRPKNIDEVVGQRHLVGPNKIIRRMVEAKMLSSMILYGPPGTGKTSIASAISGSTKSAFRQLNAATDTKKDLQIVVEEAKFSGQVVLLLDEIHRLDKPKQDFLLPHLESGLVILIGATTENPYISISPAIRSRTQIFEVKPLSIDDMVIAIKRAMTDEVNGLGTMAVEMDDNALLHFARSSMGDLRGSLNALELAALSTPANEDGVVLISLEVAEECLQRKALVHDKNGDAHYDVISAFQKSIRGSDVNASLHYLGRLMEAGELIVVCRRLLVIAYEDISFGNPAAAARTVSAVQAAEKLGLPEGRIPLAHAVIDLALSPKSNSAIEAIDAAMGDIQEGNAGEVPAHLKDSHYKGAEALGRGFSYKFPHAYEGHWVAQQYLPDSIKNARYFKPALTGKYEQALAGQLEKLTKHK